jgi:predicted ester cyclase
MTEVLAGGKIDVVDELCAPNFVNRMMGGVDLAGFKAMLAGFAAALSDLRFDIEDLVAEGDAVVARGTSEFTTPTGKKISGRFLTYYGLANGRLVEDDPFESFEGGIDLMQELGLKPPTGP